MKDNLYTKKEAMEGLINGIRKTRDAIGGTMGTGGANAVIEAMENPGHLTTNDGWTIASSIKFADPLEEMGRKILLEAISRANKQSGDGSSTTTVITAAIIEEGLKHVDTISPQELKRSLEECIPSIADSINEQKRDITVDEVGKVAAISAEDEEIGELIQEIYQQIGKDGIIHWDISKTSEDTYTIGNGITIEGAGYVSPYMADIDETTGNFTNQARWKNPKVLITKQKITSAQDVGTLFESMFNQNIKEVVVFCSEYEAPVIADLVRTRAARGFKTLLIKMPTLWSDEWFEDLALASGATIINPEAGLSLQETTIEHLGTFGHITATKDETFIDGIADLSEHIATLKKENTDQTNLRASRLNTMTARLFIGAESESALSYKRLKVEDAISAAWQALNGGIVAGGGSCLAEIAQKIPKETVGGIILGEALKAPAKQIATNAGSPDIQVGDDYLNNRGFNSKTGEFVDMFEAHITDPANIVLNAVKNAVSVAASILTVKTIVTIPREDDNRIT